MVAKLKNILSKKALIIIGIVFVVTLAVLIPLGFAEGKPASEIFFENKNNAGGLYLKDALDQANYYCSVNCPKGYTCKNNIPKCKRATTLHTETCSQTSNYCAGASYPSGATITYGNETITEGVLTTGDAFDCDVNGDGTYDSATERFYYVSDYYDTNTQNFNDKVAVLIYYSNVQGGVANTAGTAYDCTNQNYHGPVTAREQLPTTIQWSNVSLYKETRKILASNNATKTSGGDLPTEFSYAGYAARLLTYQEAYNGCNSYNIKPNETGGLDAKCQFLMEGTQFSNSSLATIGPWLETPTYLGSNHVYDVLASSRLLRADGNYLNNASGTNRGARPTIEVLKSEISY